MSKDIGVLERKIAAAYTGGKEEVGLNENDMWLLFGVLDDLRKLKKENAELNTKLIDAQERVAKVRYRNDDLTQSIMFSVEYADLIDGGVEIVLARLFAEIMKHGGVSK